MSQKKGIMSRYFESNLLVRILLGLVLGVIAGMLAGFFMEDSSAIAAFLTPFGDIFIRLLKMIVQPVILFTLIVGTSSIAPSQLGKVGVKILVFYMLTSLLAIIVGLIFGNIFRPGLGMEIISSTGAAPTLKSPPLIATLLSIIPTNPFAAIANGDVLPTICFAIFFGIGLAFCRENKDERIRSAADTVFKFFDGAAEVIFKIVRWVMQYAPIGVFALIFVVFSKHGAAAFGPLFLLTLTVYLALIAQLFFVYGGICAIFKFNYFTMLKKVKMPMLTAFVTRSSGGTLPISMNTAEKEMGVKRSVYGFTLPLGATINMDGTTIYLGVCAMFIANAIGMPLTFQQQLVVVLTAVLASIGTAGVPGAGAIMLLMVLQSVGLNLETGSAAAMAYAMVLGIDALLDMGRTAMNVTGDMVGTAVVAKSEGEIDLSVWENKKA